MKKVLLFLGILVLFSGFVSAVECVVPTDGMVITEDTTFCEGEYNFIGGTSIRLIGINYVLDCNNSTLIGNGNGIGISFSYLQGITIKNCRMQNFNVALFAETGWNNVLLGNELFNNNQGAFLRYANSFEFRENNLHDNTWAGFGLDSSWDNLFVDNLYSNNGHGIVLNGGNNNFVLNNSFMENDLGITLSQATDTTVTQNYFSENHVVSVSMWNSAFNSIWDNIFFDTGIIDLSSNLDNTYCINGVGNHYFDGATGPTCDEDSDGIEDDLDMCDGTIEEQIIYGCSCNQILDMKPGEDTVNNRQGCSQGLIGVFTDAKGWAKDLFPE